MSAYGLSAGLTLLRASAFEVLLAWRHMQIDLPPTLVAATVFTLAAWRESGSGSLLLTLSASTAYLLCYCYIHSLANQVHGAREDALNKPFRPIPSGMTTVERTRRRFVVVAILYLLLGWSLGLLPWTLLWLAVVVAYNFAGWDRYWWIKNEYPPTGYLVQSVAAWQIGGTLTAHAWTWIILGVCYWQLVFIQDLRDVAGDRAMARATLPVLIGDTAVRILGCLGLTLFTFVTWWITTSQISSIWLILFTTCCAIVVVRLAACRCPQADNITYQLYAAFSIILGAGSLL
ncbi:UbiA family prenyltransferase [Streptomyces sparsus]